MLVRQLPWAVADSAHCRRFQSKFLAYLPHGYQRKVLGSRSVAVEFLAQLAPLLGLNRQGCGRAGEQAGDTDRFPGFFTPAILAGVDADNRLLDFLQQLALAIPRAQLERMLLLDCRPVCGIWHS